MATPLSSSPSARRAVRGLIAAFGVSSVGFGAMAPFLVLIALTILLLSVYNGPAAAVVHEMVPARLAATAQGTFMFAIHLLGNAPAPAIVGWFADGYTVASALHVPVGAFVASGLLFLVVGRLQGRAAATSAKKS